MHHHFTYDWYITTNGKRVVVAEMECRALLAPADHDPGEWTVADIDVLAIHSGEWVPLDRTQPHWPILVGCVCSDSAVIDSEWVAYRNAVGDADIYA
jgi:hypothetical protein